MIIMIAYQTRLYYEMYLPYFCISDSMIYNLYQEIPINTS